MKRRIVATGILLLVALVGLILLLRANVSDGPTSTSNVLIGRYLNDPAVRPPLMNTALTQCDGAPFVLPSTGMIGLMYGDTARPYRASQRHTGMDIFGDGLPGTIPVYAVADGWLTRLDDWLSSVIIRHDDPLQPGRTLWTYYTHMAARDGSSSYIVPQFPRGTTALPVKQGTLLGYQGEYAGSGAPIAMHLHLSLVLSDADGSFRNEAVLDNTLDPSPYFGLSLRLENEPQARPLACE